MPKPSPKRPPSLAASYEGSQRMSLLAVIVEAPLKKYFSILLEREGVKRIIRDIKVRKPIK